MVAALQDFDTDKTATQSIAFFRNPCYSASPIGLSELYFWTLDAVHFKIEAYSDKMSLGSLLIQLLGPVLQIFGYPSLTVYSVWYAWSLYNIYTKINKLGRDNSCVKT